VVEEGKVDSMEGELSIKMKAKQTASFEANSRLG
jgi:hypothetical protein